MSSDINRLRRLVGLRTQRRRDDPNLPPPEAPAGATAAPAAPESGSEKAADSLAVHDAGPEENVRADDALADDGSDWSVASAQSAGAPLHKLVPGRELVTSAGTCFVSTHAYPLDTLRGPQPVGGLLTLPPAVFEPFHPAFKLNSRYTYRHAAFLDTETTGLGGGAGIYCFMVGIGAFEHLPAGASFPELDLETQTAPIYTEAAPTHFVVRQFFMRNPAEERAVLTALDALLARYAMTVTFNGRNFDLPLLRTRFQQNRRFLPNLRQGATLLDPERPHLDLLHPARRLWRRRLQSCRLINLEQMILGLQRSEEDVPGYLIPQLYTDYVQTGRTEAMRRVFYHNLEDIVTMVGLADQLTRAFGEISSGEIPSESTPGKPAPTPRATTSSHNPADSSHNPAEQFAEQHVEQSIEQSAEKTSAAGPPLHGLDWASLAQAQERAGQTAQAEHGYRQALQHVQTSHHRADIYARLGRLLKRQERWQEAADIWQEWLTSVPGANPQPYVELAKLYEWQLRDLEQAEMWAAWALHNVEHAPPANQYRTETDALRHRVARLRRKRQAAPPP